MLSVARAAVALSVAVIILTLAVIFGFNREITERLTGISSHVVVASNRGVDPTWPQPIRATEELRELFLEMGGVERYSSFISRSAIIKGRGSAEGVVIKGVDSLFNRPFLEGCIKEGALPDFGRRENPTRELLLSRSLAQQMGLGVGDRVELLLSEGEGELSRLLFKVGGLYSSGMEESDRLLLIADIEHLRRSCSWAEDQISGYDIWLKNPAQSVEYAQNLNYAMLFSESGDRVGAQSIEELYPAIMGWLITHRVNGAVIVVIMVVVAAFNMITALLILVLERRSMILTLKSLGMSNGALQRVFIYRALYILLYGLAWGNAVGIGLALAQQRWGIIKLDAEGYMLSQVPIGIDAGWVVMLNICVIATIMMVMIAPTRLVTGIKR